MNPTKPFAWWALIGALLISSLVTMSTLAGKRKALTEASARLSAVQQERDQLAQDIMGLRTSMDDQNGALAQLRAELARAEQEAAHLRQEYARLQDSNTALTAQLADATTAKAALELKLSSIKGLKSAIQELRVKQWQAFWAGTWQHWIAKVQTQRTVDQQRLTQGNRGLLVRDGVPTAGARTTLQVRVLDPQTE